jgi:hypothetical protein
MHRSIAKSLGLAAAGAMALSLAACGSGGGNTASNAAGSSSFDASFNASFDKSTHDSCVTSATQHGAAADVAEKYCSCLVVEADKLSTQDKMSLPMHQDKMEAMAKTCVAQIGGQATPATNAP